MKLRVLKNIELKGYRSEGGGHDNGLVILAGDVLHLEPVEEKKCCDNGNFGDEHLCQKMPPENQPLTPKDVGMTKAVATIRFVDWMREEESTYSCMRRSDEEFDRLFQQFLNQHKK